MPDITDPTAIAFCNEVLRPIADKYAQLYSEALAVNVEWVARGGSAWIPNTADPVIDGAAQDGRPEITGADVNSMITRLTEVIADLEANSAAKLNTILAVAVHAQAV